MKRINSKQLVSALLICFSAALFWSCDDSENDAVPEVESLSIAERVEIGITSESAADDVMEDIDDIAEEALIDFGVLSNFRKDFRDRCADKSVVIDTVGEEITTTITLTFDGTCISPKGKRVREGKIIIVKTGKRNEAGARHTLTFEDFSVDSIKVEGVRVYENISDTENDEVRTVSMTLTGGKLTFPDETFVTREASTTRVRNKVEQTVTVTGSASGVSREGVNYSSEITQAIVFDKTCEDTHIPVEGIKTITRGDISIVKNYGDGTCDNLVEVTTDGAVEVIEVESRKRFPKARRAFLNRGK